MSLGLFVVESQSRTPLPPVALDVRLPPLHPKLAAQLQFMTVGHGSLFAGRPLSFLSSLAKWAHKFRWSKGSL